MVDDFIKYIEENHLFSRDDRILLAVSGGIDSMVMSHLFLKTDFRTGIAHCNFCLRAEESDKDELLVSRFATQNGIRFYSRRFETRDYAREHGISIQMAARELRYEWFESVRSENGFDFIAVAHNLNDNIETLLINLTRGTGISGLTGMKPASNKIVRPLLFATRQRITDYRNSQNIPFREDNSNAETRYTRNKIRHLIIPVLKEINPSIEETLNETAARLAGINKIVSACIAGLQSRISIQKGNTIIFNINELKDYLANSAVIFELFRPFGITRSLTKDLVNVLKGKSGGQIFTHSHRLLRNRQELIVSRLEKENLISLEVNNITDLLDIPCIVSAEIITVNTGFNIPDDRCIALLDYDALEFPMVVRPWKKGDSFFPFGMRKRKKLSDYFVDRKYAVTEKEKVLILESGGKIAWIIGERIDDRFRIKENTSKVLRIEATGT